MYDKACFPVATVTLFLTHSSKRGELYDLSLLWPNFYEVADKTKEIHGYYATLLITIPNYHSMSPKSALQLIASISLLGLLAQNQSKSGFSSGVILPLSYTRNLSTVNLCIVQFDSGHFGSAN